MKKIKKNTYLEKRMKEADKKKINVERKKSPVSKTD